MWVGKQIVRHERSFAHKQASAALFTSTLLGKRYRNSNHTHIFLLHPVLFTKKETTLSDCNGNEIIIHPLCFRNVF